VPRGSLVPVETRTFINQDFPVVHFWHSHHLAFCWSRAGFKVFLPDPEIAYPVLAGYSWDSEDKEHVLVNNKCQCVTVTSKFVPSKENPDEEILERNIRIL